MSTKARPCRHDRHDSLEQATTTQRSHSSASSRTTEGGGARAGLSGAAEPPAGPSPSGVAAPRNGPRAPVVETESEDSLESDHDGGAASGVSPSGSIIGARTDSDDNETQFSALQAMAQRPSSRGAAQPPPPARGTATVGRPAAGPVRADLAAEGAPAGGAR